MTGRPGNRPAILRRRLVQDERRRDASIASIRCSQFVHRIGEGWRSGAQRAAGAKDAPPGEVRLGARAAAALWMMGADFSFRYFSKAPSVVGSLANRLRASVSS